MGREAPTGKTRNIDRSSLTMRSRLICPKPKSQKSVAKISLSVALMLRNLISDTTGSAIPPYAA